MTFRTKTVISQCPYCWQRVDFIVDCSVSHQEYVEDCYICCRPITLKVWVDEADEPCLEVYGDSD